MKGGRNGRIYRKEVKEVKGEEREKAISGSDDGLFRDGGMPVVMGVKVVVEVVLVVVLVVV